MRLATVAGAPGSGKTSLIIHALRRVRSRGFAAGIFKIDVCPSPDEVRYRAAGFAAVTRPTGDVCPDHAAMVSLSDALVWARRERLDLLVFETAGLCHRCSPFLTRVLAVGVVSGLGNLGTPCAMRPLLEGADIIALARAELLSHAEREVFIDRLRALNPRAHVLHVNGLTGEGVAPVSGALLSSGGVDLLDTESLRAPLPAAYCHFCQGEGSGHE